MSIAKMTFNSFSELPEVPGMVLPLQRVSTQKSGNVLGNRDSNCRIEKDFDT